MNNTALELFPGWYNKGINKEATTDELNLRRKAIAEMVKIVDTSFWINLTKVYLGNLKFGSQEYNQITEHVKKGDDNFSIQNENVVRLICGCTIAHKIDENNSNVSDFLALALLTTDILSLQELPIPELRERAFAFWVQECESKRKMDMSFKTGSGSLKNSGKIDLPEISADPTVLKTHSDAITKAITALQKDINGTNGEVNSHHTTLEIIKQNFIALSEEVNILWWLFGAYSSTLKKAFNKLSPGLLSILTALELEKLTESLPGIGGLESIIHRALSHVDFEAGSTHSVETIVGTVNGYEDAIKKILPPDNPELSFFTPILSAVKCRSDFAGNEWKSVYKKSIAFDVATKIGYENISIQLYKELSLVSVIASIKS